MMIRLAGVTAIETRLPVPDTQLMNVTDIIEYRDSANTILIPLFIFV